MATYTGNPHSNDAALRKTGTTSFSATRSGTTASSVISAASTTLGPNCDNASDFTNFNFDRAILPFDTSAIGSGTATSGTLDVTVTDAGGPGTTGNIFIALVGCNLASAPTIATTDWGNIGTTVLGSCPAFDEASTGTKTFTLNAAGLAAINGSGYTTFAVLMSNDYGNDPSAPANIAINNYTYCAFYSSTGTTPPLLTVTYTPATPAAPPLGRRDSALLPFYSFPD